MVTQITPINLIPGTMIPRVNISQYDTGARVLKFQVYNGDSLFTFTNAMTVALVGTKPDGKGFSYEGTIASNMPTFDVTAQMSAVAGKVRAELIVFENGQRCGSGNFVIFVEEGALGDGTDMSDSDYAIINDALEAAFDLDHFYADLQNMVTEAVEDIQVIQGQTVIDPTLTVSGAAADAKATGDMARNFLEALMTETTTEASVASIDDAAGGLPLKKLTANIVPAQAGEGDPSPDNVRAITGYTGVTVTRTGKNIVEIPTGTYRGLVITRNDDGTFNINGTTTNSVDINIFSYNPNMSLCPFRGNYKISINGDFTVIGSGGVYASDNDKTRIFSYKTSGTYATTNGIGRMWMYFPNAATVSGDHVQVMAYPADMDDEFEPYTSDTYPVTLPSAVGTFYGGTLTVNSDGSGTLTVDHGMRVFDGSEQWALNGSGGAYRTPRGVIPAMAKDCVCNMLLMSNTSGAPSGYGYVGSANILVYLDNATAENLASWVEFLQSTNMQVVYPLSTPTTYALSAVQVAQMLQGNNNIWMDAAGTVQATYYANTALYVDKKIAELQALVLENQ